MTLTHEQWRTLLLPVAREAVERGEFADVLRDHQGIAEQREIYSRIIASYAAADLAMTGRTLWFPMDEVRAASGDAPATLSPLCDAPHSKPAAFRPVGSLPLSQERKRA